MMSFTQSLHTTTKTVYVIALLVLLCSLPPAIGHAQPAPINETLTQRLMAQGVNASLNPKTPAPLSEATITLSSFRHDLKKATIAWSVNGELQSGGIGESAFTFVTGDVGSQTRVSFVLETATGIRVSEDIVVRPARVLIHWEAQTYTPILYRGRALFTPQSTLRFIALPEFRTTDGSIVDPGTLVYTWKQGAYPVKGASGYGNQTLEMPGDLFKNNSRITVEVESRDGTYRGAHTIEVPASEPRILAYEFHPLRGVVYARAITDTLSLTEEETAILVEPFHLESTTREQSYLEYTWTMDRRPITARSLLTLRRVDDESSRSQLALQIARTDRILQRTATSFTVFY